MVKFPLGSKIEACAAREAGRYSMHGVKVEADATHGARAVATDGRSLAVVPCELEAGDNLTGQVVAREALTLARKVAGAKREASVIVAGETASAAGQTSPTLEGEFPRYSAVIPAPTASSHAIVALNATYLRAVLDALNVAGAELQSVTICIEKEPGKYPTPVVITSTHARGGLGVVMPITVDGADPMTLTRERIHWARGGPVDAPTEKPAERAAPAPVVAPPAPKSEAPAPIQAQPASVQAQPVTFPRMTTCWNCPRDVLLIDAESSTTCPTCRKSQGIKEAKKPAPKAPAPPRDDPRDPPVATVDADTLADVDVRENDERDGIEIRFPSKPAREVLAALKLAGWHWNKSTGCWYTRRTDRAREFARNLTGRAL